MMKLLILLVAIGWLLNNLNRRQPSHRIDGPYSERHLAWVVAMLALGF